MGSLETSLEVVKIAGKPATLSSSKPRRRQISKRWN